MSNITFEHIHSPAWANANRSALNLLVKVAHLPSEVMFSASPDDPEPYGQDLFKRAVAEEFGPITDYVAPSKSAAQRTAEGARDMVVVQAEIAPLAAAESLEEATPEELERLASLRRELVDLYRAVQGSVARSQAEVTHAS